MGKSIREDSGKPPFVRSVKPSAPRHRVSAAQEAPPPGDNRAAQPAAPLPDTSTLLVIVAGAIVAGFVQGLSGFAFGLTASSIWAWWLPPQLVAVMAVFGALTGQVIAALTTRRAAGWSRLMPLLAGAAAGLPVGLWLLPRLDADWFRLFVGVLLAVWCPLMLVADRLPRLPAGRFGDALAGMAGGVTGAVGGFTGPLPTLWATLRGWPKDELRSVIQNFNLVTLAVIFVSYLASGVVTRAMWPALAWMAPTLLVPVLLGARLYTGISPEAFRRVVLTLLAMSGVALLARALPALLARSAGS